MVVAFAVVEVNVVVVVDIGGGDWVVKTSSAFLCTTRYWDVLNRWYNSLIIFTNIRH